MIPVSRPFRYWSKKRTASSRHSMRGPMSASCGKLWFHGPISAFTGVFIFASMRGMLSRYPSSQPPIRKTGTWMRE